MTHIICRASNCLFWEQGSCGSEEIEYEPDVGCLTFQDISDLEMEVEEDEEFGWEEEEIEDDLFEEDEDEWEDLDEEDDWDDL